MESVYTIERTQDCPNGTRGRTAVFELFKMDRDVEKVILTRPTENDIFKVLREKGMLTMKEDAIVKALNREIPIEEVGKL